MNPSWRFRLGLALTLAPVLGQFAVVGLLVLGLWRLYRHSGGRNLLLFAPVAWLFCNLSQYENMLYGMQMCHYFAVVGVVWALVFLTRWTKVGLALAIVCGVFASVSILNGLLV